MNRQQQVLQALLFKCVVLARTVLSWEKGLARNIFLEKYFKEYSYVSNLSLKLTALIDLKYQQQGKQEGAQRKTSTATVTMP